MPVALPLGEDTATIRDSRFPTLVPEGGYMDLAGHHSSTGVPTLTKTAAASPEPEHARSSRVWFDEMHHFLRFLSLGVFYFQTDLHVTGLAHISDVAA